MENLYHTLCHGRRGENRRLIRSSIPHDAEPATRSLPIASAQASAAGTSGMVLHRPSSGWGSMAAPASPLSKPPQCQSRSRGVRRGSSFPQVLVRTLLLLLQPCARAWAVPWPPASSLHCADFRRLAWLMLS